MPQDPSRCHAPYPDIPCRRVPKLPPHPWSSHSLLVLHKRSRPPVPSPAPPPTIRGSWALTAPLDKPGLPPVPPALAPLLAVSATHVCSQPTDHAPGTPYSRALPSGERAGEAEGLRGALGLWREEGTQGSSRGGPGLRGEVWKAEALGRSDQGRPRGSRKRAGRPGVSGEAERAVQRARVAASGASPSVTAPMACAAAAAAAAQAEAAVGGGGGQTPTMQPGKQPWRRRRRRPRPPAPTPEPRRAAAAGPALPTLPVLPGGGRGRRELG